MPTVAVLGNHDYESGKVAEVSRILCDAGVHVLDGSSVRGAGRRVRGGEGVRRRVRARGRWAPGARRSSSCSCRRRSTRRSSWRPRWRGSGPRAGWSLLHYSPIEGTVEGEPKEIYPVPRLQPAGGAAHPLSGGRGVPRSRAPRRAGGAHQDRRAGLQRVDQPAAARSMPDGRPFRLLELPVDGGTRRLISRRREAPSRPARPARSWPGGRAPPRARRP